MPELLREIAYGLRSLRNNPGFAVTALVTLALGIGASTAIFSVLNAVLLRPLPYPDADRLVIVTSDMVARNVEDFTFPAGDIAEIRDAGTDYFTGMAAVQSFELPMITQEGRTETLHFVDASTNLFSVLGVNVAVGRDFTEADGSPPPPMDPNSDAPPPPLPPLKVILGYGYWQSHFGGDRTVVGRMIDVPGGRADVVGVAPKDLALLFPPDFGVTERPDLYMAAQVDWASGSHTRTESWRMVARLKPGSTLAAARGQVTTIADQLAVETPIKKSAGYRIRVEPMRQERVADVRSATLALMGGAVFVLLIACANVANLLMVRSSRRERELAVRAALGASRARLLRQMLVEAFLLSAFGAVLGLALAELGVKVMLAIGPQNLPTVGDVTIDLAALAFTVFAGATAAVLFGVVPALRASRSEVLAALRASGRTSELGPGRSIRNGVVVAEVALAFVLLVGSGLMLRSFVALTSAEPGFQPDPLLTFDARNMQVRSPQELRTFLRTARQELAAIPGVEGVTVTLDLPFRGVHPLSRWGSESAIENPEEFQQARLNAVTPGYFEVMGTEVLAGRTFTEDDDTPTSRSVVIDRVLAHKAFPGQPLKAVVGKHLYVRYRGDAPDLVDVVGVVDQQRPDSPAVDGREQIFFTNGQFNYRAAGTWVVRTGGGDPAAVGPEVRSVLRQVAPSMPIMKMRPMDGYLADVRAPTRWALVLIGTFAAIALILAVVGLFGVLSTMVRQRTAEIGVRMAFGASRERIFRLMVGEGMRLSAVGLLLGGLAALVLTRTMRSMLVGVTPTDPPTFVFLAVLFLGVAALSSWLPSRRAAALDPAEALRGE